MNNYSYPEACIIIHVPESLHNDAKENFMDHYFFVTLSKNYRSSTYNQLRNKIMNEENRVISRIFKYVRVQQQWSQSQFAKRLGISQATLSRIENGLGLPQPPVIQLLESLTGQKMIDLVLQKQYREDKVHEIETLISGPEMKKL